MVNKKKKKAEKEPEIEPPQEAPEEGEVVEPVEVEAEPLQLQMLRLQADFDNFRKRQVRERAAWITRANEDLFLEMLPAIDHFEMGLKSAEDHQTDCSVTDGFKLVYNQLLDLLKKFNVTPIEAVGQTFDPHNHEALTHMPSEEPAETVVQEIRRGYLLGDKLLRAAQVVVSSGAPAAEAANDESAEEKESN
jgi:molecular chaperone GrpE